MKKPDSISIFFLIVLLLPILIYGILTIYQKEWEGLPILGPVQTVNGLKQYHQISDFHLQNQDGQPVSTSNWKNKIVVADFFFTHCPSICPKMTASLKRVNELYKEDAQLRFASFSVDPERDSATQLKQYAERFKLDTKNWDLLTGDKKEIYKLARNSFMIVATDGDGGPADFIHSEKLVLIDSKGRIRGYYDGTNANEVDQLQLDIKKLKHEN